MSQSAGSGGSVVRQAIYGNRLDKALLEASALVIIGNFPSKYLKSQGTITLSWEG